MKITGLKETIASLQKIARKIPVNSNRGLQKSAELGTRFAQALVPHEKGFTEQGIISFPQSGEIWVIESSPPKDTPEFALNILLDDGRTDILNWGTRNEPKTGEFGFMRKTVDFLEEEFAKKMNFSVERSLK